MCKENKEQIDLILIGVRELEERTKKLKIGFFISFIMSCLSIGMVIELVTSKKFKYDSAYHTRHNTNENTDKDLFDSFHPLK